MEIRTDLAMEARVLESETLPPGVSIRQEERGGIRATIVRLKTAAGAKAVGKPKGTYITVDLGPVLHREKDSFDSAVQAVAWYLRELLDLPSPLPVLVAGLGNRDVTPDAIGPMTADHILVTRHMLRAMPGTFGKFRPVSAVVPGVTGTTGMESAETVRALAERTRAAAVIAVDAIAARELQRLCSTVQLSDTGIIPGSGIGNSRHALDRQALGIPVLAVGVPTVTDAATLAAGLLEQASAASSGGSLADSGMIVTSVDIDKRVREISRVLACAINLALQPELTIQDLTDLTY